MIRRPPSSSRTDTRFPYTTLFRSGAAPLAPSRDRGAVGRVSYSALLVLARAWPLRFRAVEPRRLLGDAAERSEEHTSELQSLMRISYAVFCLQKNTIQYHCTHHNPYTRHGIVARAKLMISRK